MRQTMIASLIFSPKWSTAAGQIELIQSVLCDLLDGLDWSTAVYLWQVRWHVLPAFQEQEVKKGCPLNSPKICLSIQAEAYLGKTN